MNKKFNSQSINNVDYLTSNSKMEYNDNGDGNCDPDLEARLYAEIYYSNETYPDDNTTNINTPSSSNATVGQSTPRSLNNDKSNSEKNACNWSFDARPGQENVCSTTYSVNNKNPMGMECQSPSIEPYSRATGMFRKPYRPTKNSFQSPHKQDHLKSSNESPRYSRRNDEQYRNDNRTTRSGQRFQNTPSNESYLQLEAPRRSKRLRCQDEQFQRLKEINKIKRKKQKEKNMKIRKQGQHFNINDPDSHFVEDMSDGELGDVSFLALAESIDQTVENNTPDTVNNKSRFDKQTSCSTPKASSDKSAGKKQNNSVVQENSIIESENTSLNNSVIDASLSKYNVLDKNKKIQEQSDDLNKNQSNNNNGNESDSDGSIWEVPVPPKPAPPLIDLPDSDDELNNTNNNNNSTSSSSSSDEDEEEEQQSLSQTIDESFDITNSTQDHDDDDDDDELIDGNENSQDEPEISSNIILNCTTVQRGASSLDEIKRMRELTVTNCTQDDEDSMTESEAMNWLSIEDQMANDEEVRKKNKSHGDDTESWQNFDDSINISNSNDQNISSGDDCTINDNNNPTTSQDNINQENLVINNSSVTENIDSNTLNEEMGPPKTTEMLKKRKRNHNLSNESDNNSSKSSSPQKRQKQNKKSTANMSFDEYIFQPLPQDLVSFYNDDRSGLMNLEVSEIQCRMTRNPNLWAILDADMISSRRRFSRVTCSICQKEGHKKDHCPSKPNVMSCRMCGQVGHKESTCPHTMCLTCGKKYQSYRKTCEVCKLLRCTTCRGIGHDKTQCPDLWRKYHMTTSGTTPCIPTGRRGELKSSSKLSCCNCTRSGHDYSTCTRYRWSQHFVTPSYVTSYDNGPHYEKEIIASKNLQLNNQQEQEKITSPKTKLSDKRISKQLQDILNQQKEAVKSNQPVVSLNEAVANMNPEVLNTFRSMMETLPFQAPIEQRIQQANQSVQQDPIIFKFETPGIPSGTLNWQSLIIIPKDEGLNYPFDSKTQPGVPKFLKTHLSTNSIQLRVFVEQVSMQEQDFKIIIETTDPQLFIPLKLLLNQWMSSNREDRITIEQATPLPTKQSSLVDSINDKVTKFSALTMLRAYGCVYEVKKYNKYLLMSNKKDDVKSSEEIRKIMRIKKESIVASLYNYDLITNGKKTLIEFINLLEKIKQIGKRSNVPPELYLSMLCFNFELFTGHLRSNITDVVYKWKDAANKKDSKNQLNNITAFIPKTKVARSLQNSYRSICEVAKINIGIRVKENFKKIAIDDTTKKVIEFFKQQKLNDNDKSVAVGVPSENLNSKASIGKLMLKERRKRKKLKKKNKRLAKKKSTEIETIEIDDDDDDDDNNNNNDVVDVDDDEDNVDVHDNDKQADVSNLSVIKTINNSENTEQQISAVNSLSNEKLPGAIQEATNTSSKSPKTPKKTLRKKKDPITPDQPKESQAPLTPNQNLQKHNEISTRLLDLPEDLPAKHDRRQMSAPLIIKLALAGTEYVRRHNLNALEEQANKISQSASLLTAKTEDIKKLWCNIIKARKQRLCEEQSSSSNVTNQL